MFCGKKAGWRISTMAAQEGVMCPDTKFGIDTSMHRRDMASLPVWRVGAKFD